MGGDRRSPPRHRNKGGGGVRHKNPLGVSKGRSAIGVGSGSKKPILEATVIDIKKCMENRDLLDQNVEQTDRICVENEDLGNSNSIHADLNPDIGILRTDLDLFSSLEEHYQHGSLNMQKGMNDPLQQDFGNVILELDSRNSNSFASNGDLLQADNHRNTVICEDIGHNGDHGRTDNRLELNEASYHEGSKLDLHIEVEDRSTAPGCFSLMEGMIMNVHNPMFLDDNECLVIGNDNVDSLMEKVRNGDQIDKVDSMEKLECMEGVRQQARIVDFIDKEDLKSVEGGYFNRVQGGVIPDCKEGFFKPRVGTANAWKRPNHVPVIWGDKGKASSDGKFVCLNLEEVNRNKLKLEKALVGRLIGKKLPYHILASEIKKRWDIFGEFKFLMMGDDCFTCLFNSVEARDAVLMGGPWLIGGYILGLDKWSPHFSQDSMNGLSSPVWIRFPNLPLLYWDNDNLARIASMVGQPLWIDSLTSAQGRCGYARVCVRLDLAQKLPTGVWIHGITGNFFQKVEFEGLHLVCFNCGHIGHKEDKCGVNKKDRPKEGKVERNADDVAVFEKSIFRGKENKASLISDPEPLPLSKGKKNAGVQPSMKEGVFGFVDVNHGAVVIHTDGRSDGVDNTHYESDGDPDLGPWIFVQSKKRNARARGGKVKQPISNSLGFMSATSAMNRQAVSPCLRQNSAIEKPKVADFIDMKGKQVFVDNPPRLELVSVPSIQVFSAIRDDDRTSIGEGISFNSKRNAGRDRGSGRVPSMKEISRLGPIASGSRKKRKGDGVVDDCLGYKDVCGVTGSDFEFGEKEDFVIGGGDASPLID